MGRSAVSRGARLALAFGCGVAAAHVGAQTSPPAGWPMMRVPIPTRPVQPAPGAVYGWIAQTSACSSTCGSGTQVRSHVCQNLNDVTSGSDYGAPEAPSLCTATVGAQPASATLACVSYAGCGYQWVKPAEVVTATSGRVGCGTVNRRFAPFCRRSDGVEMASGDHRFCASDRPSYDDVAAGRPGALGYDRTAVETDQCTSADYSWQTAAWSAWSSTCSASATRSRSVTCVRGFDGLVVGDGFCAGAAKPAASETGNLAGCSYAFETTAWSAWSSTCAAGAERTRTVTCKQSDGTVVPDSVCTSRGQTKPAARETQDVFTGCGFRFETGSWGSWSSTCSDNAMRSRSVTCRRSDGTPAAFTECTSRGLTAPAASETGGSYAGCSYEVQLSGWSAWSSTCAQGATRTRTATCMRSDGQAVPLSVCTGIGLGVPLLQETADVWSGCAFTPTVGPWSVCSGGVQSRQVSCAGSNGIIYQSGSFPGCSAGQETRSCVAPHSRGRFCGAGAGAVIATMRCQWISTADGPRMVCTGTGAYAGQGPFWYQSEEIAMCQRAGGSCYEVNSVYGEIFSGQSDVRCFGGNVWPVGQAVFVPGGIGGIDQGGVGATIVEEAYRLIP